MLIDQAFLSLEMISLLQWVSVKINTDELNFLTKLPHCLALHQWRNQNPLLLRHCLIKYIPKLLVQFTVGLFAVDEVFYDQCLDLMVVIE